MRFPVKPPGTKMNKTQYCYMFSRVVSPFEPVQARVYRSSSRESLLNSLSVYLCIVFDVIIIIILYVEFVMFWVCDLALNEYLYCSIIW